MTASGHDDALLTVLARLDREPPLLVDASVAPTRFPSIDRALGGGVRRGDLVVLAGDHGVGCSALALAVALRAVPRALYLTGESHPERVHERALAILAGVSMESLRLGALDDDAGWRVREAADELRSRAPVVETLYRGGVDAVDRAIELAPTTALVVVDALESLIGTGPAGGASRADALAGAVLALKRTALERNVAVLLLAHVHGIDRYRPNRRPTLADLGSDGAVATHADTVLALYREEQYEVDPGVVGAAELLVLKQRDGALGYVDLYFDAPYLRFEDVVEG